MYILLVDDDELFLKTMRRFLTGRGHQLQTAANGLEALEHMDEDLPELVISDIQMPHMDGIELLQRVQERYPAIPVVLLTGYGDARNAAAAFRHGAYGYLQKPVEVEALLAGLKRFEDSQYRDN